MDMNVCSLPPREPYLRATLEVGMVVTVEPGLYFKADDQLAPERFRGQGVRIEDDVLVTATGYEVLSADFPRSSRDVEAWIGEVRRR